MINLLSNISGIVSLIGSVFFFINPVVTIFCAVFSLINSYIQVVYGSQRNFTTEITTMIIGLIVALLAKLSIANTIAFSLCLADAVMFVIGWIGLIISYFKFYR